MEAHCACRRRPGPTNAAAPSHLVAVAHHWIHSRAVAIASDAQRRGGARRSIRRGTEAAPTKCVYLRKRWINPLSLAVPALRLLRLVRIAKLTRVAGAARLGWA